MDASTQNNTPMGSLAVPPLQLSDVLGDVGSASLPPNGGMPPIQAQGLAPDPSGQPMGAAPQPPSPMPTQGPELPFENRTQPDGSIVTVLKGSQPEMILAVTPPPPRVKQFLNGKM